MPASPPNNHLLALVREWESLRYRYSLRSPLAALGNQNSTAFRDHGRMALIKLLTRFSFLLLLTGLQFSLFGLASKRHDNDDNNSTFPTPSSFNITAISAEDGVSKFECWTLLEPFMISQTPGIVGAPTQQLGNLANASWSSLPANFPGAAHPAPMVQ